MRTFEENDVVPAVAQYAHRITGFYPKEWLEDNKNVALINDRGDVALFEYYSKGVYTGHYFFWSRGKEAVSSAEDFLSEFFTEYDVEVLQGWTPLVNRGARWMNKRLGFKSYGVLLFEDPCEHVMMTKQEWKNKYE